MIVSIYNIKGLDFINETERVYCAVRNVSLNIIQDKFRLSPTSHLRGPGSIRTLCDICGGERSKGTGLSSDCFGVFLSVSSTNTTHSSLSTCRSYQKDKAVKPRNLKNRSALFLKCGTLDSEVF